MKPMSLRQVQALLTGPLRIDLREFPGLARSEKSLSSIAPGLRPVLEARRRFIEYEKELRKWAERRADERRSAIADELTNATAERQLLVDQAASNIDNLCGAS